MGFDVTAAQMTPDGQQGISRSLALGRILHFEALMRRRVGEPRAMRYMRLFSYYLGQNLPPDNVDQPLMINYFKQIVDKHCSYLWGQYKRRLVEVRFTPFGKDDLDPESLQEATEYGRKIKALWDWIYDQNRLNVTLWQASHNSGLYGDGVLEIQYNPYDRRIQIESVVPEYFHAMWEISNMQRLEEVLIAYPIDRLMALEKYQTTGNDQFLGYQAINPDYLPGIGVLWKRWSHTSCQVWVDDVCVQNMPNPYMPEAGDNIFPGVIPFVHIPNMPAGSEYYGYGDAEAMLFLQDELNRRMADFGDIVNVHAHPIVTLSGYSGDANDLPVGPDAIWDLGKDAKADRLEGKGPAPEVMDYVQEIKKVMHETASMPETAYGSHSGGTSHNSGLALSMAMMPVVERARMKRLRWREGIRELVKLSFYILSVKDPGLLKALGLDYRQMLMYDIDPIFADVLPKEELQLVNEAVATYANGLRSLERALETLGEEEPQTEITRIKADMEFKAQVGAAVPPAEGGTTGKNSDQGLGGSADLPGGIGSSASQPGAQISSPELDKSDNVSLGETL